MLRLFALLILASSLVFGAAAPAHAKPPSGGGSTLIVKFETPDGVPGLAEVVNNKGAVLGVATKGTDGSTAEQTLTLPGGVYKVKPRPVMSGGLRYVGVPSAKTVHVAGGTKTVLVRYRLSKGLQEVHATKVTATSISLAWTAPAGSNVHIRRTQGDVAATSRSRGVKLAPTTATTLVDSGLQPGTTYHYSFWVKPGDSAFGIDQANGPVVISVGTSDPSDPTKAAYVATPGTFFAKAADLASVVPLGDGVAVRLSAGVPTPAPGAAVVLPVSSVLRGGYLGVVTAISTDGRTVTLQAGGLGDAFEFYQLKVDDLSTIPLEPVNATSLPQAKAGLRPSANEQKLQQARASRKGDKVAGATSDSAASSAKALAAPTPTGCSPSVVGEAVDFQPSFQQAGHFSMTLDKHKVLGVQIPTGVTWDIQQAVTLSGAAKVDVKGGLTCGVKAPPQIAPISASPVPMSIYFQPKVQISISGLLRVSNVGVAVTLGFQTDGYIGFNGSNQLNGKLIHEAHPLTPQVDEGGAAFAEEVSGTVVIGPGAGSSGAGVIAGIGGELSPVDLKASFTKNAAGASCASYEFTFKVGLIFTARAWLGKIKFEGTYDNIPYFHTTLNYPGSPFHWPDGCDKAPPTPSDTILGGGVTKVDDAVTGSPDQMGYVDGFVPGAKTWVLSTGRIPDAQGVPSYFASTNLGLAGDSALTALSGFPTYDAGAYSVTVVPSGTTLKVKYAFASEEYPEYVGSGYNDVMAVFVNGTNCAVVPGTSAPVSINTINANVNPQYFVDNQAGAAGYNTTFDGLTKPLTCSVPVTPGVPVNVRITIADASDHIYDSAVALLEKGIWSE